MFKKILSFFEPSQKQLLDVREAPGNLTEVDKAAIIEDMRHANALEPGLGDDLARYVVLGAPETALLRLKSHVQANKEAVFQALDVLPYSPYSSNPSSAEARKNEAAWKARALPRAHLFVLAEGWDAPAMHRFAHVLYEVVPNRSWGYGYYEIAGLVDWLSFYLRDSQAFILSADVRELLSPDNERTRNPVENFGSSTQSIERLAELFAMAGASRDQLYQLLYPNGELRYSGRTDWQYLNDLNDFMLAEPQHFEAALGWLDAKARQDILRLALERDLLSDEKAGPAYREIAFRAAGDGSRNVSTSAIALLRSGGVEPLKPLIETALGAKVAADRKPAIMILCAFGDPESLRILREHAPNETAKALKKEIEAALVLDETLAVATPDTAGSTRPEDGSEGYYTYDGRLIPAEPPQPRDETLVAEEVRAELADLIAATTAQAKIDHAEWVARSERADIKKEPFDAPFPAGAADKMMALLRDEPLDEKARRKAAYLFADPVRWEYRKAREQYDAGIKRILARPDVTLETLTRIDLAADRNWNFYAEFIGSAFYEEDNLSHTTLARVDRLRKGEDLRRVLAELQRCGVDIEERLQNTFDNRYIGGPREVANASAWMALLPYLDLIEKQFHRGRGRRCEDNAITMLWVFPELPGRFLNPALARAYDGDRYMKAACRALLAPIDGITPIIAQGLTDGKAKARGDAAQWLAERGSQDAVAPLLEAAKKEKDVATKAAILKALTQLGQDVSHFFSRETLKDEAEKGLAKTRVDYSDLFDADNLPVLHWESGEQVDETIVKWWFARAHKLKAPGGDPLLRMALEKLKRKDAETLGQTIFNAWIAFDTVHFSSEEADAEAAANAAQRASWRKKYEPDFTEAMAYAEIRREVLARLPNSAQPHRGLLALCSFMPATEMARVGRRYLKDYGKRAPQSRAILEAMAANPQPVVIQALLDVSKRHKQPGGRKLAGELVDRIAEENDWTREGMADRVVPTAGVDDAGLLDLSIGEKVYAARLVEDEKLTLKLQLLNPQGKPVSSLPTIKPDPDAPPAAEGEEDEATQAKAAKKLLSDARKELKQTVENQKARLFEAMCTERRWTRDDFESFVLAHPIMNRLAQHLVFEGRDAKGEILCLFRPMDDGTLTDVEDGAVQLDTVNQVSIAHRMTAGEDAASAWSEHFRDYEIAPLFDQFSRNVEIADGKATEIKDREGWLISLSALRSTADKLGWRRGSVEDGGVFSTYERHFPGAKLAAVVSFAGDPVGDAIALTSLTALENLNFVRMRGNEALAYSKPVPLNSLPKVMLAEAIGDYHAMAAAGIGYDPEWQKKTWC